MYGCFGFLHTSSASPVSTILPRVITIILSLKYVVRNKEHCYAKLSPQVFQQVYYLRLYGHVERAYRLVAYYEFGLDSERPGYANALPLSAGKLVGVPLHVVGGKPDGFEELGYAVAPLGARHLPKMYAEWLGYYLQDVHTRV